MRRIDVVFDPAGEIEMEVLNVQGPGCEDATRFLEAALGKTLRRRRKPEFATTGPQARQSPRVRT